MANGVGSLYSHATSECGLSSITQADAHSSTELTPLTDLNGLVRFGERRNLVSARVPSRSARPIPLLPSHRLHCVILNFVRSGVGVGETSYSTYRCNAFSESKEKRISASQRDEIT